MNNHCILRQYLHVDLHGEEADGLALQQSLPGMCRQWLTPAIESVLERFSPMEGGLYIERLDIDAGLLTVESLGQELAESVARALEKSLLEKLTATRFFSEINSDNLRHITSRETIHEAFVHFLKSGCLPWSFRLPVGSSLEDVVLGSLQDAPNIALLPFTEHDTLLRVLVDAAARKRLVRQFSQALLAQLLSLLAPASKKVMDTVLHALHQGEELSAVRKDVVGALWEAAFADIAIGRKVTITHLAASAYGNLSSTTENVDDLVSLMEHLQLDVKARGFCMAGIRSDESQLLPRTTPDNITEGNSNYLEGENSYSLATHLRKPAGATVARNTHPDMEDGRYIGNAGLILVHPFLPTFFASLKIAVEDTLIQPERALCLLHFLTTGHLIAPEYELMLPKILCGVPLEAPVAADMALTAAEQEEAAVLLEAVIRHWEALRNTSPDGLRGTFLLRPGKISLRDGDWLLQVESKTCDILLEQLPWGIAMIKLPWMERMLWVEWR